MRKIVIALGACGLAAPVLAQDAPTGDAAAGEAVFSQCQTCHVVVDPEGNTLAGRNARTGPNLYGVAGRQAGVLEDFRYGDDIVKAGEQGLVWDETAFVGYVQDPTGWLRDHLGDPRARGKMTYRLRSEDDALNVYAYLASLAPAAAEGEAAPSN